MTDEELIARLRVDEPVCEEHFTANDAADRIEALVKDVAYWQADSAAAWDKCEERRARAERLEAALRKIAEGNFIGRAEGYAFAALKGDDHA